ncbi:MAG: arsenate reductase ArsC [Nitrospirae bacterium]|nr:arsenate reductase ArsC [Nitrospirota bacterium]
MAEGFLRHLAGDRFDVASAGTDPVGLNPGAVEAMKEVGVDIARQESKKVDRFLGQRFDYVITVCDRAKEACPTFPWAQSLLHWSFDDPAAAEGRAEERRAVFRRVRDEIAQRIRRFMARERKANKDPAQ